MTVQENLDFLYLFDEVAVNFIEGQFKRSASCISFPTANIVGYMYAYDKRS